MSDSIIFGGGCPDCGHQLTNPPGHYVTCPRNKPREETTMSVDDTLKERGSTYGDIEDEAKIIHQLKGAEYVETLIPQNPLSHVQRHCLDMIFVKIARIVNGDPNHADNWHDIAGYATLVEKQIRKTEGQVNALNPPTHRCPSCQRQFYSVMANPNCPNCGYKNTTKLST